MTTVYVMRRINNGGKRFFVLVPFRTVGSPLHGGGDTKAVRPTTALYGAHKAIKTSVQMYTLRMSCNAPCTSALSHLRNAFSSQKSACVFFFSRLAFSLAPGQMG